MNLPRAEFEALFGAIVEAAAMFREMTWRDYFKRCLGYDDNSLILLETRVRQLGCPIAFESRGRCGHYHPHVYIVPVAAPLHMTST